MSPFPPFLGFPFSCFVDLETVGLAAGSSLTSSLTLSLTLFDPTFGLNFRLFGFFETSAILEKKYKNTVKYRKPEKNGQIWKSTSFFLDFQFLDFTTKHFLL